MRIVENTPSVLRLKDGKLWMNAVCFGAAAIVTIASLNKLGDLRQLFPAAFVAILGLIFLRSSDVTFDKRSRTCRLRRLDVIRVTLRELRFEDISEIRIDVSPRSRRGSIVCRLVLVAGADAIPLSAVYEPGLARYGAMRDALVEAIAASGHRPIDPVYTLAKAGRIIEAVNVLRQRDGLDLTSARARAEEIRASPRAWSGNPVGVVRRQQHPEPGSPRFPRVAKRRAAHAASAKRAAPQQIAIAIGSQRRCGAGHNH